MANERAKPLVMYDAGLGSKFDGINRGIGSYLRDRLGADNIDVYTSDNNQILRFSRMRRRARTALEEGRDVVFVGSSGGAVEAATFAQGLLRFRGQREKYLPHLKVVIENPVTTPLGETLRRLYRNSVEAQHRSYSEPATWLKGIDSYDMFRTPEDPPRKELIDALEKARPDPIDYTGLPDNVTFDDGELAERYNRFDDLTDEKKTALKALRKQLTEVIEQPDLDVDAVRALTIAQCNIVEPYLERAWRGEYEVSEGVSPEQSKSPLNKGLEKVFGLWNLARGTVNGMTGRHRKTLRKLEAKGLKIQPVAFRHDPLAPVPEAVTMFPGTPLEVFAGGHATHYVSPPENYDKLLSVAHG